MSLFRRSMKSVAVRRGLACAAVGLCLPLWGCSAKPMEIAGTVSYAGEPVPEGTIQFEPVDRKSNTLGASIRDGQYRVEIRGELVRPTTYLVRIEGMRKTGKKVHSGPPFDDSTLVEEIAQYLPTVYNSASTLKRELTADARQQVDFDLPPHK
jgi:hypothetical protein